MLQEAAHDADHADVLRRPGHARNQAADAAHDQIDLHALAGGLHQPVDDRLVRQRVDLDADVRVLAVPGAGDLPVDHLQHPVLQAVRRDQQVLRLLHRLAHGQRAEDLRRLTADGLVVRHHAQVGIQAGGLLVVVARADLRGIRRVAVLHALDQAELAVHLVAVQAVDHVAAGLLQPAAPLDVVLLVKARLELHEHQHVLAVFGGLNERLDDLALLGHAVERHFDGNDALVVGGLLQHRQKRLHALVRIGEQLVALADLVEHRAVGCDGRAALRDAALVKQLRLLAQDVLNAKEERQVQRGVVPEDVVLVHVHVLAQRAHDLAVQLAGELQAHRREALAPLDQLRHELTVVDILLIERVRVDIGVARHADEGFFPDRVARKDLGQEVQNQLLGEHVRLLVRGDLDQPREHARAARHDAQLALAALALEHGNSIDILVAQERKRLAAAHDDRGDQRRDLAVKVALQLLALLPANLPEIDQAHAGLLHAPEQLGIDEVPALVEPAHGFEHLAQLFLRGHLGLVFAEIGRKVLLIHQRAHAHHKELVEVALIDRREAQPLAQGRQVALGLLEHALVELEPGELTVHVDGLVCHGFH